MNICIVRKCKTNDAILLNFKRNGSVDQRLNIISRFGESVRYYRKQRHLTQEELALLCNFNQHYISNIERGTRNISLRVVSILARALGVRERDLL